MAQRLSEFEQKIKISSNNMTRVVQKNVKFLEGFLTNSKADVKPNISNIKPTSYTRVEKYQT